MVVDPVLGPGAYALGVLWLVVTVTALAVTWRAVRVVLDHRGGAIGAVAGSIAVLGQLTLTGQLLGAVSQLRALPFAVAMALEGAAGAVWLSRGGEGGRMAHRPPDPAVAEGSPGPDRLGLATAVAAIALVGFQWITHAVDALDRGMTHADTLWYHAPFSARFLQTGSLGDLGQLGYAQARYFPLGSELLHTEVALPFHRDVLSPLVNLGFFALAVAAALAIGAAWRARWVTALAVVAVLGIPTMAGTQPGQASNDVVVVALLLSAVALAVHAEGRSPWLFLAGLALGLAMGAKVTTVVVAGVLLLAVAVLEARSGAPRGAVWWLLGAALPVVAWPIRNVVVVGSPLPFFDLRLGPIHWEAVTDRGGPTLLEDWLGGTDGWGLREGIRLGFGPLWPLVLVVLVGALLVVVRGPQLLRPAALASALGAVAFTLLPNTGGSSFQFNLRYLTPALALGAAVTACLAAQHRLGRQIATVLLATVVVVNLVAEHHERVDAWPLSPALTVAVALAVVAAASLVREPGGAAIRPVGAVVVIAVVVGGGWLVQRHSLEHRYVATGLHDDVLNAAFREVSGTDVHVLGTPEAYPFFGADLSNEVVDHTDDLVHGSTAPEDACKHWRTALRRADRVVISEFGFLQRRFSAEERATVFASDPAVTVVLSDDERAIYGIDGGLDPAGCPTTPATAAASGP